MQVCAIGALVAIMVKEGSLANDCSQEDNNGLPSASSPVQKISEVALDGFLTIDQRSLRALHIFQVLPSLSTTHTFHFDSIRLSVWPQETSRMEVWADLPHAYEEQNLVRALYRWKRLQLPQISTRATKFSHPLYLLAFALFKDASAR